MRANYDGDVVAWANEQAALLRAGRYSELDIEHIADEVEDVGKSEQRELVSRMAILLCHLLKWQFQPERQGKSWLNTIKTQRRLIKKRLQKMPSLNPMLNDPDWLEEMWLDGVELALKETGLEEFPESCIWTIDQVMDDTYLPE
ncbi:MAG: DUF29 domain-containing protein [Sulfurimonas sp.]|nr:DUF29 domain-containing protein [Sulfurimonas sp.]